MYGARKDDDFPRLSIGKGGMWYQENNNIITATETTIDKVERRMKYSTSTLLLPSLVTGATKWSRRRGGSSRCDLHQ